MASNEYIATFASPHLGSIFCWMVTPATKKEPHKEERSNAKKTKFITQKFGLLIQKYLSLVFYDRKKKMAE